MRQRNDTPYPWTFAAQPAVPATDDTAEQPETDMFVVNPGETADRPNLLDGWTALDDGEPETGRENARPDSDAALKTTRPKRTAGADSDKNENGGELR